MSDVKWTVLQALGVVATLAVTAFAINDRYVTLKQWEIALSQLNNKIDGIHTDVREIRHRLDDKADKE